jgi:lipopolysaccharide biosynthesis glycosyltransferase
VKSINIQDPDQEILYRITENEIIETDEIFNFVGYMEKELESL